MVCLFSKPVPSCSNRKAHLQDTLSPGYIQLMDPVLLPLPSSPELLGLRTPCPPRGSQATLHLPAATRSQEQRVQRAQGLPPGRCLGKTGSPAPSSASPIPLSESLLLVFTHPPSHQWKAYFSSAARSCVLATANSNDRDQTGPASTDHSLEGSRRQANQGPK